MAQNIVNNTSTPIVVDGYYLAPRTSISVDSITVNIQTYINNGLLSLGTSPAAPAAATWVLPSEAETFQLDPNETNPVTLNSLISGEDQTNDWMQVASGANQYYSVIPAVQATSGTASPKTQTLGIVGAAGDYLKSLVLTVSAATDSYVYLQDGNASPVMSGTTSTAPSGTTTFAATASAAQTAAINAYANYVLTITYIPTGGSSITIKRKVISHAAVSASTAVSFVVDVAIPAGASATAWSLEQLSAFQIMPYNQPVGTYQFVFDTKSTLGGWKLSIGSTVTALATGKFS